MKPIEEPPPFGGSWLRIYCGVLIYVFVLIVLFYWFTRVWNQ